MDHFDAVDLAQAEFEQRTAERITPGHAALAVLLGLNGLRVSLDPPIWTG
jgi:hypothetical protein